MNKPIAMVTTPDRMNSRLLFFKDCGNAVIIINMFW